MTRARLLLLGALLLGGLGILTAALAGVEFRGGRLPWGGEETEQGPPGGSVPLEFPDALLDLLVVVVLGMVAVYVGAQLLTPEGRRRLLRQAAVLGAVVLVLLAARGFFQRLQPGPEPGGEPGPPAVLPWSAGGEMESAPPPPSPPRVPGWAAYLGAALLAGAAAVLLLRWWSSRRPSAGDEVREALAEASADLQAGLPVADVVIRCWAQMVAIVSKRVQEATAPEVTPRELAQRLVALGFREEGVLVLTRLFEEVRYGHKDSEPRRGEALAALAAVQRAYG
ncbi:MAG: hypothetical protein N2320_05520 [Candidatus Bipolaricaulota bacterium]|nr:hypothetical protein [Candidatus Bipolaricaulota bacterium]